MRFHWTVPVLMELAGCQVLPVDPTASASAYPVSAHPTCTDPLPGAEGGHPVRSIVVDVQTRDEPEAATRSQLWLDLGFEAWPLPREQTATGKPVRFVVPLHGDVTSEDLFELRLEKKGAFGFTGAWDVGGVWRPARVSVTVDGRVVADVTAPADMVLKSSDPAWRVSLREFDAAQRLAFGLRNGLFGGSSTFDAALSAITTPFKRAGISGWQTGPVPTDPPLYAAVVGVLRAPPSPGFDGFVSLDIEVEKLGVAGRWYCRNSELVRQPRYVRVEYYRYHDGTEDRRFKGWQRNERLFVRGDVRWDTDRQGFYEIHPRLPDDVAGLPE